MIIMVATALPFVMILDFNRFLPDFSLEYHILLRTYIPGVLADAREQ